MKRNSLKALMASAVLALQGLPAFAQFEGATEKVLGLYSHMAALLKYVLAVGALVSLTVLIVKLFKGEKEAAERLIYWVLGLSVGFALIVLLETRIPEWISTVG